LAGVDGRRCRLIRFEDFAADPAREIARVIDFLGLDPALYPFNRVDEIPVFGSSTFGRADGADGERVHWRPVPKDPSFDPLGESGVMAASPARAVRLAGRGRAP